MDLDNFEEGAISLTLKQPSHDTPKEVLEYLDTRWYGQVARGARWMDLIGDYAGTEPFVLEGDSLLQLILEDELLALGRDDDPSFQIAHALYSLERLLREFTSRSAMFDVVFWDELRHLTLSTGKTAFVVSSRRLARTLLFQHLLQHQETLGIKVLTFTNLTDPLWVKYRSTRKPMFVMLSDGGAFEPGHGKTTVQQILVQRSFMFDALAQGLSVTLLKSTEFRESKILSFVIEQRFNPEARKELGAPMVWTALQLANKALSAQDNIAGRRSVALSTTDDSRSEIEVDNVIGDFITTPMTEPSSSLLYLFSAHCLLLEQLPLNLRSQPLPFLHSGLVKHLLSDFLPDVFSRIEEVCARRKKYIDIDGRIFLALVRYTSADARCNLPDAIGASTIQRLDHIWPREVPFTGETSSLRGSFPVPPDARDTSSIEAPRASGLLPFSHPVLDETLSSIRVTTISRDPEVSTNVDFMHFGRDTVFVDTKHWHNNKRAILPKYLGGDDYRPLDAWARKKKLKRDQFFMANLGKHAQTLTGALGSPLQRINIVVSARKGVKASEVSHSSANTIGPPKGKSKKTKEPVLSSADKLRAKIKEDKQKQSAKEDDPVRIWWTDHLSRIEKLPASQRILETEALMRNPKARQGWLASEVLLYRLHLEFTAWINDPDREERACQDKYTVSILRMAKSIYALPGPTTAVLRTLACALLAIGLGDLLPHFEENFAGASATASDADRLISFDFVKVVRKSGAPAHKYMLITEHPVVWQLRVFGEYMDRSMDSAPDRRVQFDPDAWQKKVLDCIDEPDHSILVVAPTSAGKTFIAYYAMEKVLRDSNDGILVYIAPTKALVSQIAAEVYARFSKNLTEGSLWAIHTRDWRVHDPQKCQILVTVPEVLSIMLLSPPLARTWTPRIKRVILDEIHSIGQQEGGAVWEQILLLAPCPIIGLSATIGEPEKFNRWLQSVQEAHGFKHTYIHYPHRYSHLRKFNYSVSTLIGGEFTGLNEHQSTERLTFIHPIATLRFGARTMPSDLALEAADTLTLYQALVSCQKELPNVDLESLNPVEFFDASIPLRQRDVLAYESKLKEVLEAVIKQSDPHDTDSTLRNIISHLEDPLSRKVPQLALTNAPSKATFHANLIHLASDLHIAGDLPAIFFSFDRSICERMAEDLLRDLVRAEEKWRKVSPEWKRKIAKWEEWKAGAKHRQKLALQAKKAKKDPDSSGPTETQSSSWEASFDPEDPSPQFSFANTTKYPKAEMEEAINGLVRWGNVKDWVVKALLRGIAVHHAGMNKQYRSLVESLFRLGYVRIMIATGTLALGINAPAKTAVFAGDSPWLTALMYRQCAGRAGRRGFDLLGKVVFYGITQDRIQRLVLSRLPSIGGNFPLTSTMTLRLLNLLVGSDNAPVAVKAIRSLLSLPQISVASLSGKEQLLHHLRFSIDYLRRARLLNQDGTPLNLYGLAAHLYYTEPSNLAIIALFRAGVIHRICNQASTEQAKREFVILMAHLFGRRRLPRAYTTQKILKEVVKRSPSLVILPPMPEDARRVLIDHDRELLHVFKEYALTYAKKREESMESEQALPLSGVSIPKASTTGSGPFFDKLRSDARRSTARSPFVATSGHADDFQSVEELVDTAREGLSLNKHAIPSMSHLTEDHKDPLNAYLLDFYAHGQTAALEKANGIRRGEVWYLLQDFALTLMTIRGVVEELMTQASTRHAESQEDTSHEDADVESDSGYATGTVVSVEPIEADDELAGADPPDLPRPARVNNEDWKVYTVVDSALKHFNEKFKAMWA